MPNRKIPLMATVFLMENSSKAHLRLEGETGPFWYVREDNLLTGWLLVDGEAHTFLERAFWSDQSRAEAEIEQRILDSSVMLTICNLHLIEERDKNNDSNYRSRTGRKR